MRYWTEDKSEFINFLIITYTKWKHRILITSMVNIYVYSLLFYNVSFDWYKLNIFITFRILILLKDGNKLMSGISVSELYYIWYPKGDNIWRCQHFSASYWLCWSQVTLFLLFLFYFYFLHLGIYFTNLYILFFQLQLL